MLLVVDETMAITNGLRELLLVATESIFAPVETTEQEVDVGHGPFAFPARRVSFSGGSVVLTGFDARAFQPVLPFIERILDLKATAHIRCVGIAGRAQVTEADLARPWTYGPGVLFFNLVSQGRRGNHQRSNEDKFI